MRVVAALLLVLLTAATNVAGWWWFNRPTPVALTFNEPFPSVSFAPFRRGQSPLSKDYPPPAQVEEDLKSLVGVAKGVRTYTAREGLEIVPELARKFGLEVTHSAWLGREEDINQAEVEALIKTANENPDVVKRVIVGNEVLLRKDLKPQELIAHLRKVRSSVKQPVSYADVWAFYLSNPEVADEVDFLTIHILPYWEDEPVAIEDAAQHIVKIYRTIQARFPGKPILIGEAGWPTRGRNRGPAAVNMENAATFVRTLAEVSKTNGFDYNVVEAFDQPWKAKLEGTVGAFWGVVDESRKVKFGMSGPVEANPHWQTQALAAALIGAGAIAWALVGRRRYAWGRLLTLMVLAQGLATCGMWQGLDAWWISYSLGQDIQAVIRIFIHSMLLLLVFKVAAENLKQEAHPEPSRWAERLTLIYGLCAWGVTLLLLFDGRYRDIPNLEFLAPCVGVAVWGLMRLWALKLPWPKAFAIGHLFAGGTPNQFGAAKLMTIFLLASALLGPLSEAVALYRGDDFHAMHPGAMEKLMLMAKITVANGEMLVWSVMLVVMAVPYFAEWRMNRVKGEKNNNRINIPYGETD